MVIGAPGYDGYPDSGDEETGRVYVFFSRPSGPCIADFNGDGLVDSQDFFDFLNAFFVGSPTADVNDSGQVDSQDFFDFLNAFFGGCP